MLGKKQAFKTGKALKTYPLEVIFSSPLKRARQTADIVTEVLQVPVYTDEHFTEVDIGEAEGMHFTKVKELYAEAYEEWRSNPAFQPVCFKGGETKPSVLKRAWEGLNFLKEQPYTHIGIATHGILLEQLAFDLKATFTKINNGVILYLYYEDGWHFGGWIEPENS